MINRELQPTDASAYLRLCVQSVAKSPQFAAVSSEEIDAWTEQDIEKSLERFRSDPNTFLLGCFDDGGRLVGTIKCLHHTATNWRHKCTLYGLFFVEDFEAAKELILAAIEHCKMVPGVEIVHARASAEDSRLQDLYVELGFSKYGVEPRSLKIGNVYHNEVMLARIS